MCPHAAQRRRFCVSVMNVLSSLRASLHRGRDTHRLEAIRRRFAEFTMIPAPTYVENLRLARSIAEIPGCIVECGVWRGGMIAGIAQLLGPQRRYHLFDSFAGLPPAKPIDGPAALEWQCNLDGPTYHDNCSAPREYAERAMRLSGVTSYRLVPGWFNATLPEAAPTEPIALLRLDADWYESTIVCLQHLFPRVQPGGLVVLDDYYTWDGCSRALHDFLSQSRACERIESHKGICLVRKLPDPLPSISTAR